MSQSPEKRTCPDGGSCGHGCAATECFRVQCCGPLSGVFPNDRWPEPIKAAYGTDNASHADAPRQVVHEPTCSTCRGTVIFEEGMGRCPRCRVVWDRYNDEDSPVRVLTKAQWADEFGAPPVNA